jgi:hypothetical protein
VVSGGTSGTRSLQEPVLGGRNGYAAMIRYARQWPVRAAGASRIGWCTTAKLLVDGPAKLTGAGS